MNGKTIASVIIGGLSISAETIISIIIGIVLISTAVGAFLGFARRWKKSLLRFGFVAVELVSAIMLSGKISTYVPADAIVDFLNKINPMFGDLIANVPSLMSLAFGLVRPIVFILLFIAGDIASLVLYFICSLFIGYRQNERDYPMAGMLIGALQGILVALVLISPVVGYASLADQTVASYKSITGEEVPQKIADVHEEYVKPIKNHPLVSLANTLSEPIFNAVVTFDVGGETFKPNEELHILLAGFQNVRILAAKSPESYGAAEKEAISNITSLFDESVLVPNLGAEVLAALANKWSAGESFLGIAPPTAADEFDIILDSLYTIFRTSTADTLRQDMVTIGDFLILMVDYDVTELLGGEGDVLAMITTVNPGTGKTFIRAAIELLDSNPHMAVLRTGITRLSANLFGNQLGTPADIRENYGDMVTSVVDILKNIEGDTNEEKIEALTPTIKDELKKNDIDLSPEIVDEASRFLLEELEKNDITIADMTEEDVYDILDRIAAGEIEIPIP